VTSDAAMYDGCIRKGRNNSADIDFNKEKHFKIKSPVRGNLKFTLMDILT
jgi:hypothetical protein